jgi:hypothetical protein
MDLEKEQRAEDTVIRKTNADGAALVDNSAPKRLVNGQQGSGSSTMAQFSGGSGLRYRETKVSGSQSSTKHHPIFRKRERP